MERRGNLIFLDNAATTQGSPHIERVIVDAMNVYGNPSSLHSSGTNSSKIIDRARHTIAGYIGADDNEVYFTSSGSEANNMALKGFYFAEYNKPTTIITTPIEHKSVLKSCVFLQNIGCNVKYVSVDKYGFINLKELEALWQINTAIGNRILVSVQFANNEIGTIQHIKEIGEVVHRYNGVFHTDAVQAFPEIKIDVNKHGIDMMSVSGHKFGCPKGIGFLYKRSGVSIESLIHGGSQEFGLRAGTENIPYIAGLNRAIEALSEYDVQKVKEMRDYMIENLLRIGDCVINGSMTDRLANNISISFKGIDAEALLLLLDTKGICISSGSACNSHINEPSYVLKAIGVDEDYIYGTIRISLSENITYTEIDTAVEEIKNYINALRLFK